ncbi:MAG: hypothetical protein KAI83_19485 [Thiomargarita sp.]|nr:hypothetical protein [Thiomargarita sp.]
MNSKTSKVVGWVERERKPPFLMNEKNEKVGFVPLPTLRLLLLFDGFEQDSSVFGSRLIVS